MKASNIQPLLSVIVPVYNGAIYIDDLFAQFSRQNMERVELVLIDDGSADDSYEIIHAWKNKVSFEVALYHQENKGVSAARNLGVDMAKGQYLTFVDVDDGVAPEYIAELLRYAQQGIDVLVFDSVRVEAGDGKLSETAEGDFLCQKRTKQEMLMEFIQDPTRFGVYNLLLRRRYLTEHSIAFPVGYKYYEDYDYLLQLFAQTDNLLRLKCVLYYYIQRQGSAMGRFTAERINCLRLMKYREGWLEEYAPRFAPVFSKWGVARLYWSVLWQAALALPSYKEFAEFARLTHAKQYLVKLKGYPDKLLRLSTGVFLCCKPAYYLAVRMVGTAKSKVEPIALAQIREQLLADIAFY